MLPILICKISQRDQRIKLIRAVQDPYQVDEPDHERQLDSYKQLFDTHDSNDDRDEFSSIFCHCLYGLEHSPNDLSLHENVSIDFCNNAHLIKSTC
jgi:hypothetical protein